MMGAFTYSNRPDLVLKKMLFALKRDGRIYINTATYSVQGIQEFLKQVKGIQFDIGPALGNQYFTIEIIKTGGAIYVPELQVDVRKNSIPPERVLKVYR